MTKNQAEKIIQNETEKMNKTAIDVKNRLAEIEAEKAEIVKQQEQEIETILKPFQTQLKEIGFRIGFVVTTESLSTIIDSCIKNFSEGRAGVFFEPVIIPINQEQS